MRILAIDFETTGVDTKTDEIIEIGALVWDVERNCPLQVMSEFVRTDLEIPEIVQSITGITNEDVQEFGLDQEDALRKLKGLAKSCQYAIAHNGTGFDKPILERYFKKYPHLSFELPWIDTLTDVPYPDQVITRKLPFLAAEHQFVNPFAHRALFDVLTMMKIVSLYDFKKVIELAEAPSVRVVAQVCYEEREKAKDSGFRWDPSRKVWYKDMKRPTLESQAFQFPVSVLEY